MIFRVTGIILIGFALWVFVQAQLDEQLTDKKPVLEEVRLMELEVVIEEQVILEERDVQPKKVQVDMDSGRPVPIAALRVRTNINLPVLPEFEHLESTPTPIVVEVAFEKTPAPEHQEKDGLERQKIVDQIKVKQVDFKQVIAKVPVTTQVKKVKENPVEDKRIEKIDLDVLSALANLDIPSEVVILDKNKPTKNVSYSVAFDWPKNGKQRQRIRQVLHQCLGVRLAKINSHGEVLVLEGDDPDELTGMSPYVRVYRSFVSNADDRLIRTWRERGIYEGQIVRFYPQELDKRLFSQIQKLLSGSREENVDIRGALSIENGQLVLDSLRLNQQSVSAKIVLADFGHAC